ncbi:hypothetical protein M0657_001939 [Pyricularia oryzae]|nr:hypothetical protein M9X92_006270 [Pyricularia oryzae]KAI7929792.1 hypothetical protein M0657_001939 [Pyricularia oryzae]
MRPLCRRRSARRKQMPDSFSSLLTLCALASIPTANAFDFKPAPEANLDLSQLGRVGLAGDFSGLSLYQYEGQSESQFNANGSESLLARAPNGALATVVGTDASINAMCAYVLSNGDLAGVVLGGNFTSIGTQKSPAIAIFNPNTSEATPLPGLEGRVDAVLCDQESSTIYVGGTFRGNSSTNAITWKNNQWTDLPFGGFNGQVRSISKASNGHIIFGGEFTGLGNGSLPSHPDGQAINIDKSTITAGSSSSTNGFSDPRNIVCKAPGATGAGNTWLLQDNTPGFWQASFKFGFQPTKLRLRNTHQDGRGTRTWRFTAQPINGIMNFTYIDPATGRNASCTSECPLSDDTNLPFQDFHFVNVIGMNGFRIDISQFYGSGGGLDGIELFQDDIFTYAINDFNEPSCAGATKPASVTATGPFSVSASLQSQSQYLSARIASPVTSDSASVVFSPDIRSSGDFSVNMYTPGCIPDNTCDTRGQVNVTINPRPGVTQSVQLFQTNNFEKYDQIFFGQMQTTGSFRPTITMTPLNGQSLDTMTFVAQRVGFVQVNSTGGLNGLFDWNPTKTTIDANEFESSPFHKLGSSLGPSTTVVALAAAGDVTFVGGSFKGDGAQNIVGVSSGNNAGAQSLSGGLNGPVATMALTGTKLYVGGSFSATQDNSVNNLDNVAVLDTATRTWTALGGGVEGNVRNAVLMTMNITEASDETVVAFSGSFRQLRSFDGNPAVPVNGFAVWVPSKRNWLNNLDGVEAIDGLLSSSILDVPGDGNFYAGTVSSASLSAHGAATLFGNSVGRFPAKIQSSAASSSTSNLSKRDSSLNSGSSGVNAGAFYGNDGRNMTVLAGHFTATATDGNTVHNIVIIDGGDKDTVTGLSQLSDNSTFRAVAVQGDTLFAGGNVTGNVNGVTVSGLISYNLASKTYNTQPPALSGGNSTVQTIVARPESSDVYVGGSFTLAGSLGCPGVCYYSASSGVWNRPGSNLEGSVHSLLWTSNSVLVAGGNMTVNDTIKTNLARYNTGSSSWDAFPGADQLPGPVEVLTPASRDGDQIWASGTSTTNGLVYIMKYDGSKWIEAPPLGPGSVVRSLQVFTLTSDHDGTDIVLSNQALMLTGSIRIPNFGSASAALFDGTSYQAYALTTSSDRTPGSISRVFVEKSQFFTSSEGGRLPLVAIVLIGLGISLVLMLLIVLAGLFMDRLRKKREGYVPAPTSMYDRGSGIQRIPPGELLSSLNQGRPGAPTI